MKLLRYLIGILTTGLAFGHAPSQDGIPYGEAGGHQLTMDYYPPAGKGPHPVVIIIHGGGFTGGTSKNGSEAYCADFLAPAGFAVFSINYRLTPQFTLGDMVSDVHTAVRFIRDHASRWDADGTRIALVGGSAGGYLSNMAGLVADKDAAAQAVVTLFGISDWTGMPYRATLDPMFENLSEDEQRRIALEWGGLKKFFIQVAHHRSIVKRPDMENALERLEIFLHRRLIPVEVENKNAILKFIEGIESP